MGYRTMDNDWREWIQHNVARGCSKDELFDILAKEGFESGAIRQALNSPPRPLVIPNLRRIDTERAELYLAEGFLDPAHCRRIIELMPGRLRRSTITVENEPDQYFRRSQTCDLDPGIDPAVQRMDERICAALQIPPALAEPTQAQHYEPGDEFKAHTDYFEAYEIDKFSTATLGQRTWTFMIYLNEPQSGGETDFVNLGVSIRPQTGLAVIWNNLYADGTPNPDTLHHGKPVLAGSKAIITKWFRQPLSSGDGAEKTRLPPGS